jgi:hypothetical protein
LEHLEDTFYREGLSKYSEADFAAAGFDSSFYANIKKVSSDESQHVEFLTGALKGMPFNFPAPQLYSYGLVADVK